MKSNKVLVHASQALVAMIVFTCFVIGCEKRPEKALPEVYPAEGNAYMKDPSFVAQLKAQEQARNVIFGEREKLIEELAALEKRAGSRAAAEKLPEWKQLEARGQACGRAFESNRVETARMLRERMAQAQADSARIVRGEARAKEISK